MGTFSVAIEIGDALGERWERIEALVDTGASYTAVPNDILERLGVEPTLSRRFRMADGRVSELPLAMTPCRLDGQQLPTLVVFIEPGAQPLLGALALETFAVAPDPLGQRLIPVDSLLMRFDYSTE